LPLTDEGPVVLTLSALEAFIRNPVRQFYRSRLNVSFERRQKGAQDDEPFVLDRLDTYEARQTLALLALAEPLRAGADRQTQLREFARRLARAGDLPLGGFGPLVEADLVRDVLPMMSFWDEEARAWPLAESSKIALRFAGADGNGMDDWLDGLRERVDGSGHVYRWISLQPTVVTEKKGKKHVVIKEKMLREYLLQLTASACGLAISGLVIGCDASVAFPPLDRDAARGQLSAWLDAYRAGMAYPLPFTYKTALAMAASGAGAALEKYEGNQFDGENVDPSLKRTFADFAALSRHVTPDGATFGKYVDRLFTPMSAILDTLTVTPHPAASHQGMVNAAEDTP